MPEILFFTLLSEGVIPIVNENDTVVVEELKFGDNDYLGTLILNLVGADLFINLTSAKGYIPLIQIWIQMQNQYPLLKT